MLTVGPGGLVTDGHDTQGPPMINTAVAVTTVMLWMPAAAAAAQGAPIAQADRMKIVVIKGEDATNIIQKKTAGAPVIEVRDRNNLPVAGAVVTFTIGPGQGASFGAGLQTLTVTTNAAGQAAAAGLTPTAAGAIQINATAAFQGQVASVTIAQTNVATAAAAGGAGAGASGAGAGAAAGGGGVSATTIGIVGAAIGGGALVATQAGGAPDPGSTTTAPPAPAPTASVARDDRYSMARGSVLVIPAPGVMANDTVDSSSRVEFAPFSEFPPGSRFTNVDQGLGGFILDLTGPPANQIVGTVVIRYLIHARGGDSNIATVVIEVTP